MRIVGVVLAGVLVLAGCGGSDDEPTGGDAATTTAPSPTTTSEPTEEAPKASADIVIKDGKATPQGKRVEVQVGEKVTLHVTSDAAEELHVHSDPEHTFQVAPGDAKTFDFTVKTPGQVAVEAHELGVTIVQLVVRP